MITIDLERSRRLARMCGMADGYLSPMVSPDVSARMAYHVGPLWYLLTDAFRGQLADAYMSGFIFVSHGVTCNEEEDDNDG